MSTGKWYTEFMRARPNAEVVETEGLFHVNNAIHASLCTSASLIEF
jgi:hypothetical protein